MNTRRLLLLVMPLALAASLGLSGCLFEEGKESGSVPPPPPPPPSSQATPGAAAPESRPSPSEAQYPLTGRQAREAVEAGNVVAGLDYHGQEVEVHESTEWISEEQPETEEVCEYAYDVASDENKSRCRPETVYKPGRVARTVYSLEGAEQGTFVGADGAIAEAEKLGVSRWRML